MDAAPDTKVGVGGVVCFISTCCYSKVQKNIPNTNILYIQCRISSIKCEQKESFITIDLKIIHNVPLFLMQFVLS